ncbi:MAG: helix-turn-helix transcriptional regulator [Candidatus Lokiarchaeota archaeon]|nr:helix-turn-helix transcriptional regulator [Candidatus Lokiarchaeota archaeon]
MHHRFLNRLTRTTSELFILTILASKKEAHTYEIQQILMEKIFKTKKEEIDIFKKVIKIGKEILDLNKKNKTNSKINFNNELDELEIKEFESISRVISKKIMQNDSSKEKFSELLSEADIIIQQQEKDLIIWNSNTAIYQVMKEFEKEELIKVLKTETHRGRSRKIYSLTKKGEKIAYSSLFLLGDLYQTIIPQISFFSNTKENLHSQHLYRLIEFLEALLPEEELSKILLDKDFHDSLLKKFCSIMFPFIKNNTLILSLINGEDISVNILEEKLASSSYRNLNKEMFIENLKRLKDKIEDLISYYS